jgi:hypothetical protein
MAAETRRRAEHVVGDFFGSCASEKRRFRRISALLRRTPNDKSRKVFQMWKSRIFHMKTADGSGKPRKSAANGERISEIVEIFLSNRWRSSANFSRDRVNLNYFST